MTSLSQRLLSQRSSLAFSSGPILVSGAALLMLFAQALTACSASDGNRPDGKANDQGDGDGDVITGDGDGDIITGDGDGDGDVDLSYELPAGYTPGLKGGWLLGAELMDGVTPPASPCDDEIVGLVRDFRRGDQGFSNGHPDFQRYFGDMETKGLVGKALDASKKPTYTGIAEYNGSPQPAPMNQTSTQAAFDQWYTSLPANADPNLTMNRTYEIRFSLAPNEDGTRTFSSDAFFPLDNAGFGGDAPFETSPDGVVYTPVDEHNYHFTTEVHTAFTYVGGEVFSFEGDDDLWVFIDNQLALDLGGLHPSVSGSIDLDSLGLTIGQEYDLDLFHAERGMPESNFRIDTTLEFNDCTIIR